MAFMFVGHFSQSEQVLRSGLIFNSLPINVECDSFNEGNLSGVTTPGQRGPGSNGNEGVLHIPQSSSITGASPSDCLVS